MQVGVYWQYGTSHVIPAQAVACTPAADGDGGTTTGNGQDDVGQFTLDGVYKAAKLALLKHYILGTGDAKENSGHTVTLRLTCCQVEKALPERADELRRWGMPPGCVGFFGTWHVRVPNYEGDAEMVLWLPPVPVIVGFKITQTVSTTQGMQLMGYDLDGDGRADVVQQVQVQSQTVTTTQEAIVGQVAQNVFAVPASSAR